MISGRSLDIYSLYTGIEGSKRNNSVDETMVTRCNVKIVATARGVSSILRGGGGVSNLFSRLVLKTVMCIFSQNRQKVQFK